MNKIKLYFQNKFERKINIVYFSITVVFFLAFIFGISFGFLHLAQWYYQPRFVSESGFVSSSLGFLITFSIFLGFSLLFLTIAIVFLILFLKTNKKELSKENDEKTSC